MGGDPPAPPPSESTASMLNAYVTAFPELLKATNAGAVPAAQAQLAANQATAPGLAELQAKLYEAYGPLLGATSNKIAATQAKDQAQSDLDVLNGPGSQLITKARELQRQEDPEFYNTRSAISSRLGDLLSSVDLNGGLSGGSREEINRSLARDNLSRGISPNTPSQTATVENAVKFGQAGEAQKAQRQGILSQALSVGSGALPTLKSGTDVFQVGTGRSSSPNAGDSKFTGVDTTLGSSAQSVGAGLLNQIGGITTQANDINANRRDWFDRQVQGVSAF